MIVELIAITSDVEKIIEDAARTCYQSEAGEKHIVGDLIRKLIKSGHHSVLEHAYATFRINGCSRSMTHQLVRHRLCSFSQQSQRYVKEDQFDYVIPDPIKELGDKYTKIFKNDMKIIQEMYIKWKKHFGLKNEDARFVLPNACCTEIIMSANFREFRHISKVRCSKHAQWEIRAVAKEMLRQLYEKSPSVFEDLAEKYL